MSNKERPKIKAMPTSNFAFLTLMLLLSSLAVCLPVGLFVGIREYRETKLLHDSGVRAEAIVTNRRTSSSSDDGDDYYITYTYKAPAPDGDGWLEFRKEEKASRFLFKSVEKGGKVWFTYAADDPSVSQLRNVGTRDWMEVIFIPVSWLALLLFTGYSFRRYQRVRKLDRCGELTKGTIVDSWVDEDSDGDQTYHIAYQFNEGIQVRQKVKKQDFEKLTVGSIVYVCYLPDDPKCSRMES